MVYLPLAMWLIIAIVKPLFLLVQVRKPLWT
jgi:hypothetical protein